MCATIVKMLIFTNIGKWPEATRDSNHYSYINNILYSTCHFSSSSLTWIGCSESSSAKWFFCWLLGLPTSHVPVSLYWSNFLRNLFSPILSKCFQFNWQFYISFTIFAVHVINFIFLGILQIWNKNIVFWDTFLEKK